MNNQELIGRYVQVNGSFHRIFWIDIKEDNPLIKISYITGIKYRLNEVKLLDESKMLSDDFLRFKWNDTFEKFKEELNPFKGTLVLNHFEVSLLIDVIEDEDDFYWVMESSRNKTIGHYSCVGNWIPLKNTLVKEDYKRLVNQWNLNHENKAI